MRVIVLGAGASKSYKESPTGCTMPIARDFFQTFQRLSLYESPWVLRDAVHLYLRDKGIADPDQYLSSGIDIEQLHSEIEAHFRSAVAAGDQLEIVTRLRPYMQLLFIFSSVVNSIQNGPPSRTHQHLARSLQAEDRIVTFNWDTLMDRALAEETAWTVDFGYGFVPRKVFRDAWVNPTESSKERSLVPKLLKLHGSTNWITSHPTLDDGELVLTQEGTADTVYVYEHTQTPFATFAGRYVPGFEPFSFGYYPPNILDDRGRKLPDGRSLVQLRPEFPWMPQSTGPSQGLTSMPLIIPPVRRKRYELFGDLFGRLWEEASVALVEADEIVVIGYSFPNTDIRTTDLFARSFAKRRTIPRVTIVDPAPEQIAQKFRLEFGIPESSLEVVAEYFSEEMLAAGRLRFR